MELYPGKEGIPASQRAVLSCQTKYEKIRQSYANLFGLEYRPSEFNSSIYTPPANSKSNDRDREREREMLTRRNRQMNYPYPQKQTRRAQY